MARVLIALVVFLVGSGAIFGAYVLVSGLPGWMLRRRIEARMLDVGSPEAEESEELVKRSPEGPIPSIDRLAGTLGSGASLARLIEQAGSRMSISAVLLMAAGSGIVCGVAAGLVLRVSWAVLAGGAIGMTIPFLLLLRRRRARMAKFEEQFPEALDLLSRAIRAGHAFTTAVGMVAQECPNPIGPEFRKTYDEQNFGLPLKDALGNLMTRVPLLDVRFFVTAVLIQRETGGNLSEILDNLAHVVRERFKVLRQVRVYTAHGRFTGYVLVALPAALAIVLSFINPEHIAVLFRERMGHVMLTIAVVLQVIGYIWIKKVIKIEV
jgi:tight adherence protein B